ncbi:glycosyltransferase family protein [Bradyrhizobium sp. 180]|nr:glycosyltransferase family protein [Bradyrhizobium sp. 180]MCK1541150.1 glycosyltransferase family protein [Bradyrhizobium sp. 179]
MRKIKIGSPADAMFNAALSDMRAGRNREAEKYCRKALALDPEHAASLHLLGLMFLQGEQHDQAQHWISRAIEQDPQPIYFLSLGTALFPGKDHDKALNAFERAAELGVNDPNLWQLRGQTIANLGRPLEALKSFRKSLAMRPDHVPTMNMLGASLSELKQFEEALRVYRRAHELDPGNADICNEVGKLLRLLNRDGESLLWFDRALELQPDLMEARRGKAAALIYVHKFADAFEVYKSMKARSDGALAELGIAHLQLLLGDFEAGWLGREARWRVSSLGGSYSNFPYPMWLGNEDLKGKTILLVSDEGFGDAIQFIRYVPLVADLGARVVLVVQDPLLPLFIDIPGVAQCLPFSETGRLPPFDFHCALMTLPLALKTSLESIPSALTYLPRPPRTAVRKWKERLGSHDKMRVGLVWSGNPKHPEDHNRSIPLRAFSDLFDVNATFISLQKDPRPGDAEVMRKLTGLLDSSEELTNFVETAALIRCLDLVIAVDTSVAHLAGALGKPTWLLLPYTPDYRWLLDRDDSPWYPTMRLFRQTSARDWPEVLLKVYSELKLRTDLFEAFQASAAFEDPF